jgi:hypothetical protein
MVKYVCEAFVALENLKIMYIVFCVCMASVDSIYGLRDVEKTLAVYNGRFSRLLQIAKTLE